MRPTGILALALPLALSGCAVYYSARETFGYDNRELLVERVQAAHAEESAAKERFQAALEAFRELTLPGGEQLGPLFQRFRDEVEAAEDAAGDVEGSLGSVQSVAEAVFDAWEEGLAEMRSPELREESAQQRAAAQESYLELVSALREVVSRMDPVLAGFRDHVLFLEHSLNPGAVASLKENSLGVEDEVDGVLDALDGSIAATEAFLAITAR